MLTNGVSACPQLPTTLPTFDEILGLRRRSMNPASPTRCFAGRRLADPADLLQVFTLHAELEGMLLLHAFESLLAKWLESGAVITRMAKIHELAMQRPLAHAQRDHGRSGGSIRPTGGAGAERGSPGVNEPARVIEPRAAPRASVDLSLAGLFLAWSGWRMLSARPLFNPDEGRYAEIPREMLSGGDWVIPHLNGLAYIEKPPLQFWATALSYRMLGVKRVRRAFVYGAHRARARCWWCGGVARRLWNPQASWRAMAVLSGMLMFVVAGSAAHPGHEPDVLHDLESGGVRAGADRGTAASWLMLLAWAASGLRRAHQGRGRRRHPGRGAAFVQCVRARFCALAPAAACQGVCRCFSPSPCPGTGLPHSACRIFWNSSSCMSIWRGI